MKMIIRTLQDFANLNVILGKAVDQGVETEVTLARYKCTRTNEQNDKIQAMVRDFMRCVDWPGLRKNQDIYRHFLAACFMKQEAVEGLEGGLVFINTKTTSQFTLKEGSDFIEWLYAMGAEHDVEWSERST